MIARRLLLLVLAACSSTPAEKSCRAVREPLATCNKDWPDESRDDLQRYCVAALSYQQSPTDSPDNLAAEQKTTFEQCTKQTTRKDLFACFKRRGCTFVIAARGETPKIWCTRPLD
jgi:hypothetical protein